jgi:hypothetical protein
MIGERVVPQPGSEFVVARGGGEDVRLAGAAAKDVRTPYLRRGPAGWLVIALRPPSGIGVRWGIGNRTARYRPKKEARSSRHPPTSEAGPCRRGGSLGRIGDAAGRGDERRDDAFGARTRAARSGGSRTGSGGSARCRRSHSERGSEPECWDQLGSVGGACADLARAPRLGARDRRSRAFRSARLRGHRTSVGSPCRCAVTSSPGRRHPAPRAGRDPPGLTSRDDAYSPSCSEGAGASPGPLGGHPKSGGLRRPAGSQCPHIAFTKRSRLGDSRRGAGRAGPVASMRPGTGPYCHLCERVLSGAIRDARAGRMPGMCSPRSGTRR